MSRIMFRQKTPEEAAADAAAKQAREAGTTKIEQQPSADLPPVNEAEGALPAVQAEGSGFALEPEQGASKPKKGRKR